MPKKLTYRQMADVLADKLTSAELDRLTELMDGDANSTLLSHLNVRNAIKNPQSYGGDLIATLRMKATVRR